MWTRRVSKAHASVHVSGAERAKQLVEALVNDSAYVNAIAQLGPTKRAMNGFAAIRRIAAASTDMR